MDLAVILLGAAVLVAAGMVAFALTRSRPADAPDTRLEAVISGQGAIAEQFRQTIIAQAALAQQVDALKEKLGETLTQSATKTAETLGGIQTRLSVIDEAQKNISQLSGQVVSLQQVLSNKQARGAFGQAQMEEIVRDGLPSAIYDFQFTLSNRNRPDCIIRLPGNNAIIVIDAKFPLEGFTALRAAASDEDRKQAAARVRGDVTKHVTDIAEKYLIPGEVQTPAIMFVPSESIYADLHDGFSDVIQKAHRAQVIVVSPNILMLALNTIQTVMKDQRMRDQANLIQKEVGMLLKDVGLMAEAVDKLQRHFNQAEGDIKDILTRSGRITTRAEKIEKVELAAPEGPKTLS